MSLVEKSSSTGYHQKDNLGLSLRQICNVTLLSDIILYLPSPIVLYSIDTRCSLLSCYHPHLLPYDIPCRGEGWLGVPSDHQLLINEGMKQPEAASTLY